MKSQMDLMELKEPSELRELMAQRLAVYVERKVAYERIRGSICHSRMNFDMCYRHVSTDESYKDINK